MAVPEQTTPSSNTYLNAVQWGGWRWTDESPSGTTTITYYLRDGQYGQTWQSFEEAAYRAALQTWANVANLTFREVFTYGEANFAEDLRASANYLGFHEVPEDAFLTDGTAWGEYVRNGDGWTASGLQPGGTGFITLVHEIGHGLGLAHPHDNGGGSARFPGVGSAFGDYGDNNLNQGIFTTMSYNDGWPTGPPGLPPGNDYGWQSGPMAFDVAAIQYLYGANMSYRTGHDTYVLPDVNAPGTFWNCIWDAGGTDQLVYNGALSVTINLTAATLDNSPTGGGVPSYASGIHGGFTIANGVVIENASGGSGNDTITGNGAANILAGNLGNDTLSGLAGNDTLTGGGGIDTMNGGAGDDIYVVDVTADQILEALNGGLDTVVAFANYTLPANVEVLSGFPSPIGLTLIGNNLNNQIFGSQTGSDSMVGGGGNDLLSGFGGNNTMEGGLGDDTYYSFSSGDTITELAGAGSGFDNLVVNYNIIMPNSIEVLIPVNGATSATGTAVNDVIYGANITLNGVNIQALGGNDTLYGTGQNDNLDGGADNDTMLGFGGTNTFLGGAGDDVYYTDSATDDFTGAEAPGGGSDIVVASYNATLGANLETLILTGAATSGTGNAQNNRINAAPLAHGALLNGGGGADNLFGSAFADTINGGAGTDNDVLFGGNGADIFQFNAANFGNDAISDFVTTAVSAGNHDLINLQGTGVLNFSSLNIVYVAGGASIDTGTGIIFLTGVTSGLQASDFLF